ncbi:MAG: PEP-CTERM sorting domain-containing protein [Luteolibacter sp.]
MKIKSTLLAVSAITVLGAGSSQAATIFNENFGTLKDAASLVGTANSTLDGRIGTGTPTGNNILEAQNPSSFGSGASALMAASTTSQTNLKTGGFTAFDVGTLSFSLRTNSNTGSFYAFLGDGASLTNNSGFTGSQLLGGWQINNGQLQARTGNSSTQTWTNVGTALTANTNYDFNIVFNGSATALTDYFGTNDLAAGSADIWINGSLFGAGVDIIDAQSVTALKFYTEANGGSAFELDNVLLQNVATVVPEPSTALLGAIGALALLRRRR